MLNLSLSLNNTLPSITKMEPPLRRKYINSISNTSTNPSHITSNELADVDNTFSILSSARIGTWAFNLDTHHLHLCSTAISLLNLDQQKTVSLSWFLSQLAKYRQVGLLDAIKDIYLKQESINEEQFVCSGNELTGKWLQISGNVYQVNGQAAKMMGTIIDITKAKTEDLRKKDLIAFLCHELKTPLSVVKLCVENSSRFLNHGELRNIEERLERANRQVMFMASMIDNFSSLSLLENTQLNMEASVFDISVLIHETVSDMASLHSRHIFKTTLPRHALVDADRDKIRQVLINYLSNAVKFSSENSIIRLECKVAKTAIVIKVMDYGIGISHNDQKKLFSRYARIYNKEAARVKGFGLGLFLSKEIIEKHSGRVWVKSSPGMGSTFAFSIPYWGGQHNKNKT